MAFTFRTKDPDRGKLKLNDAGDFLLINSSGDFLILFKRFFTFRNK